MSISIRAMIPHHFLLNFSETQKNWNQEKVDGENNPDEPW
jgi:hypothetical protein